MNLKLEVYLKGLKKEINREILVNDNMTLQSFCEHMIIAFNGNCKHLYQLVINEEYTYLGPGCEVFDSDFEQMMNDLCLDDLLLRKGDMLLLNYDFKNDWDIIINIKDIKEIKNEKNFNVTAGVGKGILEDCGGVGALNKILKFDTDDIEFFSRMHGSVKNYFGKEFSVIMINDEIDEYYKKRLEYVKPKSYIMNVSLEGFNKEIKRKISVDSNVRLNDFCKGIVLSMNGDLSHSYIIKIGKKYLDEEVMNEGDLNYLELKEKQRLKVIYDFGDNWVFNITISKVIQKYGYPRRFYVLSGKGYGIVDDCGGIYNLNNIFDKNDDSWGNYDINEFDIKKINKNIDIWF